jgi:2-desacetyl-2-hydroxyethyl bacteriochlorophyllide A dehydrogenase
MHAIVFESAGSLALRRVPDPVPQPDEVVIRVTQAGICGTDLHIFRGEYMSAFPLVPGHEFVGEIVECGTGVHDLHIGQRVVGDPNLSCGDCEFCRSLQPNHCLRWQGVGITRSGAFAEYVTMPARAVYPIPDSIGDTAAAFIEPLACVVYALSRIRVRAGDNVLLYGAGPMGLLLTQALQRVGAAQVTAVEPNASRAALARQLGATNVLTPAEATDLASEPGLFHVVVEATGVPTVIARALDHLRPGGTYLQFGVAPIGAHAAWEPYRIFRNDWNIVGSFALSQTFAPAIRWLAAGVLDVAPLVSHVLPLDQFQAGFEAFTRGESLKVHVRPQYF